MLTCLFYFLPCLLISYILVVTSFIIYCFFKNNHLNKLIIQIHLYPTYYELIELYIAVALKSITFKWESDLTNLINNKTAHISLGRQRPMCLRIASWIFFYWQIHKVINYQNCLSSEYQVYFLVQLFSRKEIFIMVI